MTPSIAITAHILAPSVYATAVVSFTGTVTRELLYLPRIDRAPAEPPPSSESSLVYSGTVRISALKSVGTLSINEADEYVEITNIGTRAVDVSGWSLTASELVIGFPVSRATFNFPSGTVLAPDQICRIYTNGGGPLDCGLAPGFRLSIGLWPDVGSGLATLRDPAGVRMAEFAYRRFDVSPTPTPLPGQPVVVSRIMYQGTEGLQEADEYVEIRNTGSTQVDLSNWSIKAFHGAQQVDSFVFDPGFIIAGGQACRIYTNLPAGPDSCGIVDGFARDEPLWPNVPNGAYSARLYKAQNVEVSRYTY